MTAQGDSIDALLEQTAQRPRSVRPPVKVLRRPVGELVRQWASSQVAAYRFGLVLGYIGMMYFGGSSIVAGIPAFAFTTPEGWTPVWGAVVVAGGLVAGIGAIHAGEEPVTRVVRRYNRVELSGAIALFLTLFIYATTLLIIGYGFGDNGRAAVGSGFVVLGIQPAVRMVWLIFRPGKNHTKTEDAD